MTNTHPSLAIFESYNIRRHYYEKTETWYFSVIDIVAALTDQKDFQLARNYWKVLKNCLIKEGSQMVTKCNRLKMEAADGKKGGGIANQSSNLRNINKEGINIITIYRYIRWVI